MKKLGFYLFTVLALLAVATSCKKDKTEPESTPQNIEGVYKITGMQAKAGSAKVDVYDQLTECQKNDTWGFQEDGTFLFGGAAIADCADGDYSGTWSLNNKTFTVSTEQNTTAYHLESFNGQKLVLSTAGTVNDEPATYFITFTKQ